MKLQYRHNNGYTYLLVIREDYCELYMMDGTDDFPIFDTEYIDGHPEFEKAHGDMRWGQGAYYGPCIEAAALAYLNRIAPEIENWSGAEEEMSGEEMENFLTWLDSDDNTADFCDAEITLGGED